MRLANEKTLELNITHQLLTTYSNSHAIGTTLPFEGKTGVDSALKTPYRIVLFQYKAASAHKGSDGVEGHFKINNNSLRDQHVKLHSIASIFSNTVFYAFPLVRTDGFFEANASNLIPHTKFIRVEIFPGYAQGAPHRVQVYANGGFVSRSKEFKGEGLTGEEFLQGLKEGKLGHEVPYGKESVKQFMEKLEQICEEAQFQRRDMRLAFFHPKEPFLYSFRFGTRKNP